MAWLLAEMPVSVYVPDAVGRSGRYTPASTVLVPSLNVILLRIITYTESVLGAVHVPAELFGIAVTVVAVLVLTMNTCPEPVPETMRP